MVYSINCTKISPLKIWSLPTSRYILLLLYCAFKSGLSLSIHAVAYIDGAKINIELPRYTNYSAPFPLHTHYYWCTVGCKGSIAPFRILIRSSEFVQTWVGSEQCGVKGV